MDAYKYSVLKDKVSPCSGTRLYGEIDERINRLINGLFLEVNPISIKAAAGALGLCRNEVRLPLTPLSPEHGHMIKEEMQKAGVIC